MVSKIRHSKSVAAASAFACLLGFPIGGWRDFNGLLVVGGCVGR